MSRRAYRSNCCASFRIVRDGGTIARLDGLSCGPLLVPRMSTGKKGVMSAQEFPGCNVLSEHQNATRPAAVALGAAWVAGGNHPAAWSSAADHVIKRRRI